MYSLIFNLFQFNWAQSKGQNFLWPIPWVEDPMSGGNWEEKNCSSATPRYTGKECTDGAYCCGESDAWH